MSWLRRPCRGSCTAKPSPDRSAGLRRDDDPESSAKPPTTTATSDNLRFGLSLIDSHIFARGNPRRPSKLRELNGPGGWELLKLPAIAQADTQIPLSDW